MANSSLDGTAVFVYANFVKDEVMPGFLRSLALSQVSLNCLHLSYPQEHRMAVLHDKERPNR